jgi:hypothetical protein
MSVKVWVYLILPFLAILRSTAVACVAVLDELCHFLSTNTVNP